MLMRKDICLGNSCCHCLHSALKNQGEKCKKNFVKSLLTKKNCQKVQFNGQANVLSRQITLSCRFFFVNLCPILVYCATTLISQVVQSQNHRTNNYFSNTLTNATREEFELQQINSLVKFFFIVNNKWMYV